jgi:hypothetical protein
LATNVHSWDDSCKASTRSTTTIGQFISSDESYTPPVAPTDWMVGWSLRIVMNRLYWGFLARTCLNLIIWTCGRIITTPFMWCESSFWIFPPLLCKQAACCASSLVALPLEEGRQLLSRVRHPFVLGVARSGCKTKVRVQPIEATFTWDVFLAFPVEFTVWLSLYVDRPNSVSMALPSECFCRVYRGCFLETRILLHNMRQPEAFL